VIEGDTTQSAVSFTINPEEACDRMDGSPQLHVSMPHIEKLAEFLVLLPPILSLASLGTIQGGLARRTVLELEIRRCFDLADDAAFRHDCCWCVMRVRSVM
jgi:hypothetical protein